MSSFLHLQHLLPPTYCTYLPSPRLHLQYDLSLSLYSTIASICSIHLPLIYPSLFIVSLSPVFVSCGHPTHPSTSFPPASRRYTSFVKELLHFLLFICISFLFLDTLICSPGHFLHHYFHQLMVCFAFMIPFFFSSRLLSFRVSYLSFFFLLLLLVPFLPKLSLSSWS